MGVQVVPVDSVVVSEGESAVEVEVWPWLRAPNSEEGHFAAALQVTVQCATNDTSEALLVVGAAGPAQGTYGSPDVVLLFTYGLGGQWEPAGRSVWVQGLADRDNTDGPVAVQIACLCINAQAVAQAVAQPGQPVLVHTGVEQLQAVAFAPPDAVVVWNRCGWSTVLQQCATS